MPPSLDAIQTGSAHTEENDPNVEFMRLRCSGLGAEALQRVLVGPCEWSQAQGLPVICDGLVASAQRLEALRTFVQGIRPLVTALGVVRQQLEGLIQVRQPLGRLADLEVQLGSHGSFGGRGPSSEPDHALPRGHFNELREEAVLDQEVSLDELDQL